MSENSPAWQAYAEIQRSSEPQSIDSSLAREEALDAVLDDVLAGAATDGEHLIPKRFYSLCRNRLSKQLHRREIDTRRFRSPQRRCGADFGVHPLTSQVPNAFDQMAYSQLVDRLRSVLPEHELSLLLDIADGHSYSEMARARDKTVSSVKAKVFRVREKVRSRRISAELCAWPRG